MFTPLLAATALLSTGLIFQEPDPGKGEAKVIQDADAKKDSSTLETWDDKTAKEALAQFKKDYKNKSGLKKKLAALESLRSGRHKLLVKPLVRIVKIEKKHKSCRKLAAELLGNQANMRRQLLALITDSKIKRRAPVVSTLIRSYTKESYDSRDWKDFEKLFRKDLADRKFVQVQKAILEMVVKHKEIASLNMLLQNLDEPQPAWVDDPNNPPASYWEARWKNWEVWCALVKEALFQITDQRFNNSKEARKWLQKNRKKLQQKYRKKKKKKGKKQGQQKRSP